MRIERFDPRRSLWEDTVPTYRVDLWRQYEDGGWRSDEYVLHEVADGDDPLDWAACQDADTFVIYALMESDEGLGSLRLFGIPPTEG